MLHSLRAALTHQHRIAKLTNNVVVSVQHPTAGGGPKVLYSLFDSCVVSSGVDPSPDQWHGILKVAKEKGFLPFFDSAYQVRLSNPERVGRQCISGLTDVCRPYVGCEVSCHYNHAHFLCRCLQCNDAVQCYNQQPASWLGDGCLAGG